MFLGFSFRYRMSGSYWRFDDPTDERAIEVAFEASATDLRRFAADKTWRLKGAITVEQIATERAAQGILIFKLFEDGRLACRVAFAGDDGRRYELSGQMEWSGFAPVESFTLLPASLYDDDDREIGRAKLRFDWRADGARWIRSFRVHLSPRGASAAPEG
jgi:hypothetical protein